MLLAFELADAQLLQIPLLVTGHGRVTQPASLFYEAFMQFDLALNGSHVIHNPLGVTKVVVLTVPHSLEFLVLPIVEVRN
jgi:hypothetical protein